MSRPNTTRIPSTNIGRSAAIRPLEGKLAIVTGASRGIGAGVARNLASKGCSLVLNYTSDSSEATINELASELQSTHDIRTHVVQADMGTPTGPGLVISTAKNHFAHPKTSSFRIDIIVNNAGIGMGAPLGNVTVEKFQRIYAVNVLGPLLLVQAALPYLPNDRSGRIINISSVSSTKGLVGQSLYGGTKAALEAMTRTWSRELAERATVNAINPGPVSTDMFDGASDEFFNMMRPFQLATPLAAPREGIDPPEALEFAKKLGGRTAYVHEIAGIVGMLCSEESGWCTGNVVGANGGFTFTI